MIVFGVRGHYLGIGGVENAVRELAIEATNSGDQVIIVSGDQATNENNKTFRNLPSQVSIITYSDETLLARLKKPASLFYGGKLLLSKYRELLKLYPEALVIARHHLHVLAAHKAGFRNISYIVPSLTDKQGREELENTNIVFRSVGLLRFKVDKLLQKRAFEQSKVYVFSSFMREQVRSSLGQHRNNKRVQKVEPGLDWCRFAIASSVKQENLRKQLGLPQKEKLFLFVGRFVKAKGIHFFIEAMSFLPSYCIAVLVGEGQQKKYLQEQVVKLGLNQRVIFVAPTNLVEDYYQACDTFVMPSTYEPFGQTILEAVACGCRVVAFSNKTRVKTATCELGLDFAITYVDQLTAKAFAQGLETSINPAFVLGDDIRSKHLQERYSWPALLSTLKKNDEV